MRGLGKVVSPIFHGQNAGRIGGYEMHVGIIFMGPFSIICFFIFILIKKILTYLYVCVTYNGVGRHPHSRSVSSSWLDRFGVVQIKSMTPKMAPLIY